MEKQEYEVERILQRGRVKDVIHYLVHWKGFLESEATWEPISNLQHCSDAIIQFQNFITNMLKQKKRKAPKETDIPKPTNVFHQEVKTEQQEIKLSRDISVKTNSPHNIQISQHKSEKTTKKARKEAKILQKIEKSSKNQQIALSKEIHKEKEINPSSSEKISQQFKIKRNKNVQSLSKQKSSSEIQTDEPHKVKAQNISQTNMYNESIKRQAMLSLNQKIQNNQGKQILERQSQNSSDEKSSQKQILCENNIERLKPNNDIKKCQEVQLANEEITEAQMRNYQKDNLALEKEFSVHRIEEVKTVNQVKQKQESSPENVQFHSIKLLNQTILKKTKLYQFCDAQYLKQWSKILHNSIEGKDCEYEDKLFFVDFEKHPSTLEAFSKIEVVTKTSGLTDILHFIKIPYMWIAMVKNLEGKIVWVDVAEIDTEDWRNWIARNDKKV